MKLRHFVLALGLALPGAALANQCPEMLAKVDAALAENPQLDAEMMKEIKTLREDGDKQCKAGNDKKAVEALNQALLLLGKL